jgi:hypothetical protein
MTTLISPSQNCSRHIAHTSSNQKSNKLKERVDRIATKETKLEDAASSRMIDLRFLCFTFNSLEQTHQEIVYHTTYSTYSIVIPVVIFIYWKCRVRVQSLEVTAVPPIFYLNKTGRFLVMVQSQHHRMRRCTSALLLESVPLLACICMYHVLFVTWYCPSYGVVTAYTPPSTGTTILQKVVLKLGRGKNWREDVVERYFEGVRKQSKDQIVSCFNPSGTKIRDVCGLSNNEKIATPDELGDRCMQFLAAYQDTKVMFHYR